MRLRRAKERIGADVQADFLDTWTQRLAPVLGVRQAVVSAALLRTESLWQGCIVARRSHMKGRRRKQGVQFTRSHVISSYDIPDSVNTGDSLATASTCPRVEARSHSVQLTEVGCCGNCGDSLSTQLHIDARGPCSVASRSGGLSSPSMGTTVRSFPAVVKGYCIERKPEGVSKDGCCLMCGDNMSTSMHLLQGGPCKE